MGWFIEKFSLKFLTDLDVVFKIFKFFGRLTCTWPPSDTDKTSKCLWEWYFWFIIVNLVGLFFPLLLAVDHFKDDPIVMAMSLTELMIVCDTCFTVSCCKAQQKKFQVKIIQINFINFIKLFLKLFFFRNY